MQARSAFRRGIGEQNFEKRVTSLSYFHAFHTLGVISISDHVTPGLHRVFAMLYLIIINSALNNSTTMGGNKKVYATTLIYLFKTRKSQGKYAWDVLSN